MYVRVSINVIFEVELVLEWISGSHLLIIIVGIMMLVMMVIIKVIIYLPSLLVHLSNQMFIVHSLLY